MKLGLNLIKRIHPPTSPQVSHRKRFRMALRWTHYKSQIEPHKCCYPGKWPVREQADGQQPR